MDNMEKNYLKYTCIWALIILAGLLLMYFLPAFTVGEHVMRRVDLLGDVRTQKDIAEEPDSLLPPPPKVKPAFVDTCRAGMTCIEDYSDSTLRGMTPFYRALDELAQRPRQVRIAVFGDSFIEADILTADLRNMLQDKYGGCGVGFVTITSMTSGFRPTVRHSFGGWQSHSVMDSTFFDRKKQGISGHYFVPRPGAYVELKGQNKYASHLDTCEQASIFFYSKGEVTLSVNVNRNESKPVLSWLQMICRKCKWMEISVLSVGRLMRRTLPYSMVWLWMVKKELSWIISLCAAVRAYPCVLFLCG